SAKETIQRAIAISGLAAGDLAYEGARRALEEHERMVLQGADRAVFLKAVADPPPPSARVIEALRRRGRTRRAVQDESGARRTAQRESQWMGRKWTAVGS